MLYKSFAVLALAVAYVTAESHTVSFSNNCGSGTPTLMAHNGAIISTGDSYTLNGPLVGAFAYLQTGNCGRYGENCTTVETTLRNPTWKCAGCVSETDLTLVPPHYFSVTTGFSYQNGCDGQGNTCDSASCPGAFNDTTNNNAQVGCTENDANLLVSFC